MYYRPFLQKTAIFLVVLGCFVQVSPLLAQQPLPTDEQVEKLIKDLQEALFRHQTEDWAIVKGVVKDGVIGRATIPDPKDATKTVPAGPVPYKKVIPTVTGYDATDADGKVTKYDRTEVYFIQPPGHFQPDLYESCQVGGHTTMAVWGLVASDFPGEDPRMQKALNAFFEGTCPRSTYTLSFRLNILSHLIRWRDPRMAANYKKYLDRETDTLIKAMSERGDYPYQANPPSGYKETPPDSWQWKGKPPGGGSDNSNTQFGPFGVSAAEDALVEVSEEFWLKQDAWWQKCQKPDGHWEYGLDRKLSDTSNVNMTDAGMNSLYLVIDKLYSHKAERGYAFLKGFKYQPEAYARMMKAFASIEKGFQWMEGPGKAIPIGGWQVGYHFYGMQRLGLNCGRKYIGSRPWYENVVAWAYQQGKTPADVKGSSIQDLAWRLLCLAFGRAPVLFNKLDTGDEADWNYYVRDVAHLSDWVGIQTEKRINWQVVDLKHTLHDFQDAPILIITGSKELKLTEDHLRKLKDFCDFGGTIFLNPNLDSKEFKDSAKKIFTEMYKKEGYEFSQVPKDHPVFVGTAGRDGRTASRVTKVPLLAMSDGGRQFIFLCNGDIAGAWQLMHYRTANEAFTVMLNLRLYAAPIYQDLPGRLRPRLPNLGPGPNKVVVARLKHNGHSTANPRLYEALAFTMSQNGYNIELRDQVAPDAAALQGVNIIHITGHNNCKLTDVEVGEIRKAVEKGAFLLIDPSYGRKEFLEGAKTLVKQMGLEEEDVVLNAHRLFKNIPVLKPNRWTAGMLPRAFKELRLNDKPVGLLATLDITTAACGGYVYGNPGIGPEAARQLWVNIVADATKIPPMVVALPGIPASPAPTATPAPKPTSTPTATSQPKK